MTNSTKVYEYPAIFTREDDGEYSVEFPDLEGCYTCGDNLDDAIKMAQDVLEMTLAFYRSREKELPSPSLASAFLNLEQNQSVYRISGGLYDKKEDPVNHPSHYENSCSLECIDVMMCCFDYDAVFNFCICNAFKYLWRHKFKNGDEDLKKAAWYINRAEEIMDDTGDYEHLSNSLTRIRVLYVSVTEKEKNDQNIDSE